MQGYQPEDDLIFNTASRVPICLCIDMSGFTGADSETETARRERLEDIIRMFYGELTKDDMIRNSAEVCIVGFGGGPYAFREFHTIDNCDEKLSFTDEGKGDIGGGVLSALEKISARIEMYKMNGVDYLKAWLVIMGAVSFAEECRETLKEAQRQVLELEERKKITVVPVYIEKGTETNEGAKECLSGFSDKDGSLITLDEKKFGRFFEWLCKSVGNVVCAKTGELDYADLTDWEDI